MNDDKEIKVYGTLVNHTVDPEIPVDQIHNDALAYAKQLFDDQFGEPQKVNNYQDIINKRVKGITRKEGSPNAGTYINDNLYLPTAIIYVPDGQGGWTPIDLRNIQSLWKVDTDGKLVPKEASREVKARGFYDTSVS